MLVRFDNNGNVIFAKLSGLSFPVHFLVPLKWR